MRTHSKHFLDPGTAIAHLSRGGKLRVVIKKIGKPKLRRTPNAFQSLVRAIIYQQLSGKAAAAIHAKFLVAVPHHSYPKPRAVLQAKTSRLRKAGLSKQKIGYVRDLSKKFESGYINPKLFPSMEDEEIRAHLVAVKGIGRWTADMFLMFSLNRPDVFPTGDLGIQKGIKKLFRLSRLPNPKRMEKLAAPWRPYRTLASWYLWRMQDTDPGK